MKNILFLALTLLLICILGCENETQKTHTERHQITTIENEKYELIKSSDAKALLIVFLAEAQLQKKQRFTRIIQTGIEKTGTTQN